MNLFSSVDMLFASLFAVATTLSAGYLIGYTLRLHLKDAHTVNNSIFSDGLIGLFFVILMVPTAFFCYKELFATAASVAIMGGVVCTCLSYMAKRGRIVLQQNYWI